MNNCEDNLRREIERERHGGLLFSRPVQAMLLSIHAAFDVIVGTSWTVHLEAGGDLIVLSLPAWVLIAR
jgi:hypothetical protein